MERKILLKGLVYLVHILFLIVLLYVMFQDTPKLVEKWNRNPTLSIIALAFTLVLASLITFAAYRHVKKSGMGSRRLGNRAKL